MDFKVNYTEDIRKSDQLRKKKQYVLKTWTLAFKLLHDPFFLGFQSLRVIGLYENRAIDIKDCFWIFKVCGIRNCHRGFECLGYRPPFRLCARVSRLHATSKNGDPEHVHMQKS